MLNPKSDRLNYSELLAPPPGFELEEAVGTTYSLDFNALLDVCVAMCMGVDMDSALAEDPIFLLTALNRLCDKLVVFCQAGQISFPGKPSPLYLLLEKIVFEVNLPKRDSPPIYPSFHPKFWLLKYKGNNGESCYRTIVLSRNLTFDRSWDVSYCTDGRSGSTPSENSAPIVDFLKFLKKQLPGDIIGSEKEALIKRLEKQLATVAFDSDDKEFVAPRFIPIGINEHGSWENGGMFESVFSFSGNDKMLIMSPFLSRSVVADFSKQLAFGNGVLITRRDSLAQLRKEDCANFRLYAMREEVIQGEANQSEENIAPKSQDIHAKLYMLYNRKDSLILLGSPNASFSAINGNIEFLVCLKSKKHELDLNSVLRGIFNGQDGNPDDPFESVELSDALEEGSPEKDLALQIRKLCYAHPTASVESQEDAFKLTIDIENMDSFPGITVAPLLADITGIALTKHTVFEKLLSVQLSEFYQVTVTETDRKICRVIRIPTEGLPEGRTDSVVNNIFSDSSALFRYIRFVLGNRTPQRTVSQTELGNGVSSERRVAEDYTSLYEDLLRVAAREPSKVSELQKAIEGVSNTSNIPHELHELIDAAGKAVSMRGSKRRS